MEEKKDDFLFCFYLFIVFFVLGFGGLCVIWKRSITS